MRTSVDSIILHGEIEDNKANILLIGSKIEVEELDEIVNRFKTENNFEISFVTVNKDQYLKMTSMGLYSGRRPGIRHTN